MGARHRKQPTRGKPGAPTDQQSRLHGGGSGGKESHGSKYEGVNSFSYLSMSYIVPIVYLFSAVRRAELRRAELESASEGSTACIQSPGCVCRVPSV